MTIAFRPLSEVKMILEEAGTDISYAYDDLVFAGHTGYLIQFDDSRKMHLKIYFNTDLSDPEAVRFLSELSLLAAKYRMVLTPAGKFSLSQKEGSEEIDISFYSTSN